MKVEYLVILIQLFALFFLIHVFDITPEEVDPRIDSQFETSPFFTKIKKYVILDTSKILHFNDVYQYRPRRVPHADIEYEKKPRPQDGTEEWKEKLRKRINSEEPGFYRIIKNNITKVKDTEIPPTYPEEPPFLNDTRIEYLELSVYAYDKDHLNIIIRDADNIRWEMPFEEPYPHVKEPKSIPLEECNLEFRYEPPLDIKVLRRKTREIIFEFTRPINYTDRYIEFKAQLPTMGIFGFGERMSPFVFRPGTYSEFILDRAGEIDSGRAGFNGQGHHPMYLMKESYMLNWHVGYIRNINGQEFVWDKNSTLLYKMIGGVIDINFFAGTSPEEAVNKYHNYIGGWTLPPFWAMGKHQSKWLGYQNMTALEAVMEEYEKHELPLDAVWSDIEYQEDFNINFSFDEKRYPLDEIRALYKKYNKKWIPVIDTYVPKDHVGPAWEYKGVENLLMKFANGSNYVGFLFRENHIIDFWNPESPKFWEAMLSQLREKMHYEGLWIDANENTFMEDPPHSTTGKYSVLKFWPGGESWYDIKMPKPDAYYFGHIEEIDARDTHCILQSKYTYEYLKKTNPLPFVMSRATIPGIAKYAFHFFPDYRSTWNTMKISISSMLNFNLFGIPFSGGDVCGMGGMEQTPGDLCARWYQLGVFYPFMRNHHVWQRPGEDNHQEPYRYDGVYYETIKLTMKLRYAMLKYFYAEFFKCEGREVKVGMVVKPVWFVFHQDWTMHDYFSPVHTTQFMVGDAIMVAPATIQHQEERSAYFPETKWYDLRTLEEVVTNTHLKSFKLGYGELAPWFLRSGYILYLQNVDKVLDTSDLDTTFDFIIGLSTTKKVDVSFANAVIMDIDNFEEKNVWENCIEKNCLMDIHFNYTISSKEILFWSERREAEETSNGLFVKKFTIMGLEDKIFETLSGVEAIEDLKPEMKLEIDKSKKLANVTFSEPLPFKDGTKLLLRFN